MEMDGVDEIYKLNRFEPSNEEAVTYFLPRLLAGETLPYGADRIIYHADVYAREPRDLARRFAPVPSAVHTGDRFFFTTCSKGKNGRFMRGAGAGTWTINKTEDVYHAGAKVGEARNLSFKKDKVRTGWVMEEYRCLLPEAIVDGGEKVLCKIHLAQHPPPAARQESAAYKLRRELAEPPVPGPEPVAVTASAHAQKRPAPVSAAADLSSCKRMRMAAPVPVPVLEPEVEYKDCPVWFTSAAPVSSPAASTEVLAGAEADDDTGRFCCSLEELLGEQQQEQRDLPVEAENNIEQLVFGKDIDQIDIDELAAPIDWESEDLLRPWAEDDQEEAQQTVGGMVQEEQTLPILAEDNIQQFDIDQLAAPIDWESLDLQSLLAPIDWEEAELAKWCNPWTGNLHAPSLQGQNQFFSFAAVN